MKVVDGIIYHSGRAYITISGHSHEAYTAKEFVNRGDRLGHEITSEEYVRQCCRQQAERTGRIAKLPDHWSCAKHQGRIYVYRLEQASLKQDPNSQLAFLSLQGIKIDPFTELCFRTYKRDAAMFGEPVKAQIIFYPNGSLTCIPTGNQLQKAQLLLVTSPFTLSWMMELIGACYQSVNVKKAIDSRLNELRNSSAEEAGLADFHNRCLWCANYKDDRRSNARFCNDDHKNAFSKWKKKVVSTYKRIIKTEPFVPNPHIHSPWCPELIDHPIVGDALHDRLEAISAVLVPSVIRKQKALN